MGPECPQTTSTQSPAIPSQRLDGAPTLPGFRPATGRVVPPGWKPCLNSYGTQPQPVGRSGVWDLQGLVGEQAVFCRRHDMGGILVRSWIWLIAHPVTMCPGITRGVFSEATWEKGMERDEVMDVRPNHRIRH